MELKVPNKSLFYSIDKKLKMVDLQLKKLAIDKKNDKEEKDIEGEGYILTDRNSILEKLKHMNK
mgnify:CR=1 FL=1